MEREGGREGGRETGVEGGAGREGGSDTDSNHVLQCSRQWLFVPQALKPHPPPITVITVRHQ